MASVDKFRIEEVSSKHKVPVYAILVKQSILEAITVMRKDITTPATRCTTSSQTSSRRRRRKGTRSSSQASGTRSESGSSMSTTPAPQPQQTQQGKSKFNVFTIEECPACGQKTKRAFQVGD